MNNGELPPTEVLLGALDKAFRMGPPGWYIPVWPGKRLHLYFHSNFACRFTSWPMKKSIVPSAFDKIRRDTGVSKEWLVRWMAERNVTLEEDFATADHESRHRSSLDVAFGESTYWSNSQFPNATHESKAEHLLREAAELRANPTDPEEMADVFMLLAHLADGAHVNLARAVFDKLEKNRKRAWGEPDEFGVIEHVRDGEPA